MTYQPPPEAAQAVRGLRELLVLARSEVDDPNLVSSLNLYGWAIDKLAGELWLRLEREGAAYWGRWSDEAKRIGNGINFTRGEASEWSFGGVLSKTVFATAGTIKEGAQSAAAVVQSVTSPLGLAAIGLAAAAFIVWKVR